MDKRRGWRAWFRRGFNILHQGKEQERVPFPIWIRTTSGHLHLRLSMKALPAAETTRPRTIRRISKPVMEKRRRERINSSLETLRLLMLENIDDEKLKNPKVEKAEILESVVQFLKTESEVKKGQRAMKRVLSREQPPSNSHYQEGMRSCLLRVSHFIATKTQEPESTAGLSPLQMPPTHLSTPDQLQRVLMSSPATGAGPSPHHLPHLHRPYLSQVTSTRCDTRPPLCAVALSPGAESVWRPWPQ